MLVEQHVYASRAQECQLLSACLALCVVTVAQNESRMSYLSRVLQILFSLPNSLPASFPDMETWTSQLENYYNVLKIAGIYVFNARSWRMSERVPSISYPFGLRLKVCVSLMHTHQGCLIEHPVYPTLMGYADKSTKWIPLNIAAKEPWTGSQGLPMTQAVGEVHWVNMCGAS